jgi:hypothetical protein
MAQPGAAQHSMQPELQATLLMGDTLSQALCMFMATAAGSKTASCTLITLVMHHFYGHVDC